MIRSKRSERLTGFPSHRYSLDTFQLVNIHKPIDLGQRAFEIHLYSRLSPQYVSRIAVLYRQQLVGRRYQVYN